MTNKQRRDRVRKLLDDLRPYNAEFTLGLYDDSFIVQHDGTLPPELARRLDEAIGDIERLYVHTKFCEIMREGRGPN